MIQTTSSNDTLQLFVARSNQIVGIVNNLTDGVLYVNGSIIFSNAFAFTVQSLNVAQTIVMTAASGNSVYLLSSNAVINGSGYITGAGVGLYVSNNAIIGGNLSVHGVDVLSEMTNNYNTSNAAFVQANATNTLATNGYAHTNAAFTQANATNTLANSGYAQANATNTLANSGYAQANATNTLTAAAYLQANDAQAISIAGTIIAQQANTLASASYGQSNTNAINITAANNLAVASYGHANNAYNAGVSGYAEANSAFNLANEAIINGSYVNVKSSRQYGITYTNSLQKPIYVAVTGTVSSGTTEELAATVSGVFIVETAVYNQSGSSVPIGVTFIVPAGATYGVSNLNGTLQAWYEYS